ncbi:MAG: NAD-binding protein, partial [Rhodospirillaceae bacterium]|nr:NAD-binding protein [Rhodospirillaceae bacterium]
VIGLYAVKGAIAAGFARLFGLAPPVAVESGFLLGQSGEFAFLIVGLSISQGILPADVGQFMLLVAGLSMLAAAPVAHLGRRAAAWMTARAKPGDADAIPAQEGHVIVAGHGRVGRMFTRLLDSEAIPYVAFDIDAHAVAAARRDNKPVFFGDASRPQILRQAAPEHAQAIVVTVDDAVAAAHIVQAAKREWPHTPLFARARDSDEARLLLAAGASDVVPEATESSLQLAGRVLLALGTPEEAVSQHLAREREAELARYRHPGAG